jgi:hypothetical protein
MSASTNSRPSLSTTPSCGLSVVKGYSAIFGLAALTARRGVDSAGVRQPDQAGVGDQLEPQPDPALLAGLAGIGAARRAVGGGPEMRVAEAAVAALGQHHALAHIGEIGKQRFLVLVEHLRAGGHLEHHVVASAAVAVLAHAVGAGAALEVLLVAVVDQRVQAVHRSTTTSPRRRRRRSVRRTR